MEVEQGGLAVGCRQIPGDQRGAVRRRELKLLDPRQTGVRWLPALRVGVIHELAVEEETKDTQDRVEARNDQNNTDKLWHGWMNRPDVKGFWLVRDLGMAGMGRARAPHRRGAA